MSPGVESRKRSQMTMNLLPIDLSAGMFCHETAAPLS